MNFPHRHKILFGIMVFVGIIVYASFNVWVYQYSKNGTSNVPAAFDGGGKGPSLNAIRQAVLKGVTFTDSDMRAATPPSPSVPAEPTFTPTPTPRPTGPGPFACSPEGTCNLYSDEVRTQYCTKTYADSKCLDECGKKENQCVK